MKTILLVDDDQGILDALSTLLKDYGYKVIKMSGNKIAIRKKIIDKDPDLVILDVLLSGEDGREICKMLKEDSLTKSVPIIISSARKDFKQSALQSGSDYFLPKPFEVGELVDKIEDMVS